MKSICKKTFLILLCIVFFLLKGSLFCSAADNSFSYPKDSSLSLQNYSITIIPYTDTIVWKYRKINGKYQKRRWNETKQVWVDPDWIDVN